MTNETTTTQAVQMIPQSSIKVNDKGLVNASDHAELFRYCDALVKSGMVPKQYDSASKLFGAFMFTRGLNLPDTAIRQTAVIQGTPSIFGDLPLAIVQRTKKLTFFKEQWFDKNYNTLCFENKNLSEEAWGAVCFIGREDADEQSFSFTLDDAKKGGMLPASPNLPWSKHTKIMLRYKARAIGLKSVFADALNGVSIAEYDHDELDPSVVKDVSPPKEKVSSLNEKLSSAPKATIETSVEPPKLDPMEEVDAVLFGKKKTPKKDEAGV